MSRDPYPGLGGRDPDEVDAVALRLLSWIALAALVVGGAIWWWLS